MNQDTEYGYVEASSLSRLLRMLGQPRHELTDPTKPFHPKINPNKIVVDKLVAFAIFSAWKNKIGDRVVDKKENWARNSEMLVVLNAAHMGAYRLTGYFQNPPLGMDYDEARDTGQLLPPSKEESLLVVQPKDMELAAFEAFIKKLALIDFDQHAFIISDGKAVYEVTDKTRTKLGDKVTMPLIQRAYSIMRGYPDKPFVFAGIVTPSDTGMMRAFARQGLCWVTPPSERQRKLMVRLRDLVVSAMKFREFKSPGGTSKMWIDPKNRPIPLDGLHYEWLRENAAYIRKAFNLPDMPEFGIKDEIQARLWAITHGFTRVHYQPRNGGVTFDTCERFWTPKRQDVVSMIIADNADDIQHITVNVYSDDGKRLVRDGTQDVKSLDDAAAKVESIPFADVSRTRLIAECLRRFEI